MDDSDQRKVLEYYQDILLAVFVFMLRDKAGNANAKRLVAQQFAEAEMVVQCDSSKKMGTSGILGAVLHEWHRNAAYLRSDVTPKAVRLLGRKPSVSALIRSQDKSANGEAVAREMLRLKLIRHTSRGLYLPLGRVATIRKLSPALIDHVARSLERLLATVNFNTRTRLPAKSLIERTAFVHDLPREDVEEFRKFAQSQGSEFLANADEWLESRRASKLRSRRKPLVRAGIHVYAFEERAPHSPINSRPSPRPNARSRPSASA